MHQILVEEKRWIGEARFLNALNFCMLLPEPEAQQLATYIGWLLHKTRGGLMAGVLFILPGAAIIMALSILYVTLGNTGAIATVFFGLKAAVIAIVFEAVRRIGGRALTTWPARLLALTAFIALFVFGVPFPAIIILAAFIGWLSVKFGSTAFAYSGHHNSGGFDDADSMLGSDIPDHARLAGWRALRVPALLAILWIIPTASLLIWLGPDNRYTEIATFFSQMAVLTFGGAYAVLAWVGQAAVEQFGWVSPAEMLDGLAMAETTPGPLIIVTQHVGFMAGWRASDTLSPVWGGILGGLLTTWVTFIPCFIWIFAGAPYIERLRNNTVLSASLSAITAAVVGVILNLAVWFAQHYLFTVNRQNPSNIVAFDMPVWGSLNVPALILTIAATLLIIKFRFSAFWVLGICVGAGVLLKLSGLA